MNEHGDFYEVTPNDYQPLQDLDVSVGYCNIKQVVETAIRKFMRCWSQGRPYEGQEGPVACSPGLSQKLRKSLTQIYIYLILILLLLTSIW